MQPESWITWLSICTIIKYLRKKENYNCIQLIASLKQLKGKLAAANDLNFLQKFGIDSTETRKRSVLPKLWEGFIHPHIDRMNKFFACVVRIGRTLYLWLLHRLYWLLCFAGKSFLSLWSSLFTIDEKNIIQRWLWWSSIPFINPKLSIPEWKLQSVKVIEAALFPMHLNSC